jgi:Domain of unknown function (DUF5615)
MSLRFLIDENLLDRLSRAVTRHNAGGICPIDAVQVGDIPDLPRGSDDREILLWAEREERILLSFECGLERIVNVIRVVQDSPANLEHDRAMALQDRLEGSRIALRYKPPEQLRLTHRRCRPGREQSIQRFDD